ncbi:hypothetical protein Pmani_024909 [Petrolisthes manimaculis]|uniref:Chitin-binding type-2 domain-containing protein n=1 Tax=Petrolisthes manimaculis TaxID=1843537 RepID=A0AAE1TY90_9EUCA|nr:hypothetical protein Pmani_024909 [Petrolisthes manimaculis]
MVVVLCVAGVVSCQGPVQCPQQISDQCPEVDGARPKYFPVPDNCAQFCQCSSGTAWLFTCPQTTLWDTTQHYCNFADQVDCGSRPIV